MRCQLMTFELRDLAEREFRLCVQRLPESRDSQGQLVVPAMEVSAVEAPSPAPAPGVGAATAPPAKEVQAASKEGGMKAPLLAGSD